MLFSGSCHAQRRRRLKTLFLITAVSLTTLLSGTVVLAETVLVPDADGPGGRHAIQDLRVDNDGRLVTVTVRHRAAAWRGAVRLVLDATPGVADPTYAAVVGHRTVKRPSFTLSDGTRWTCAHRSLTSPSRSSLTRLTVNRACLAGAERLRVRAAVSVPVLRGDTVSSPVVKQGSRFVTSPGASAFPPPQCPAVSLRRQGDQTAALDSNNSGGTWDLRTAVWRGLVYPVRSDSWRHGCVEGGVVHGPIPRSASRDAWYDGVGGNRVGGEGLRITMSGSAESWLAVRDMIVEDTEDAYDPNAAGVAARTYLDHVRAEYIRDDCIENEAPVHNLYVRNSFFDGCFTAFAERPSGSESAQNGQTTADFVVENSLVYVKPQPLGPGYCGSEEVSLGRCLPDGDVWLGSYGIWKWSDRAAANVEVRNTVFRLDMPSYSSCRAQQWPRGTYVNVTLVWTGAGPYESAGGCRNTLPPGVELTEDESLWDQAVDTWHNQ